LVKGTDWRGLEFPCSAKVVRQTLKAEKGSAHDAAGVPDNGLEQANIGGAIRASPLRAIEKRSMA
jgi:hypothetical protein